MTDIQLPPDLDAPAGRTHFDPTAPDDALDFDLLVDIAAGLAAARPLWEPHLDLAPDRRGHIRLIATDTYEAWLITWPVGYGVDLHDHGGSRGVIAVAEGKLIEIEAAGGGSFRRHEVAAGRTHQVPSHRVHDVVNTGLSPAVSIHVYSPPLTEMTFYDPVGTTARHTQRIYPEAPAVATSAATRALHPSARRPDR